MLLWGAIQLTWSLQVHFAELLSAHAALYFGQRVHSPPGSPSAAKTPLTSPDGLVEKARKAPWAASDFSGLLSPNSFSQLLVLTLT